MGCDEWALNGLGEAPMQSPFAGKFLASLAKLRLLLIIFDQIHKQIVLTVSENSNNID